MVELHIETKKTRKASSGTFLSSKSLSDFLPEDLSHFCASDIERIVLKPLQNFTNTESNLFRARLVELSISLCSDKALVFTKNYQREISSKLSKLLEAIHAGSLVIDDVQDNADFRRGKPSLHKDIGVPLAINSGSLLYFWALSLIEKMALEPHVEITVNRLCQSALARGHLGQALDLGIRIDEVSQTKARELSVSAMKLKTGALMSLATELGAVICGVHPDVREALRKFGLSFGFALQSFNDLGEYSTSNEGVSSVVVSQDLLMGKPTWIWICASDFFEIEEYNEFCQQISLLRSADTESQKKIMAELKRHPLIAYAKNEAKKLMEKTFTELKNQLIEFDYELNQRPDWTELQKLAQKVMMAYE